MNAWGVTFHLQKAVLDSFHPQSTLVDLPTDVTEMLRADVMKLQSLIPQIEMT